MQEEIAERYSHLHAPDKVPPFRDFCFPHVYTLQNSQKFPAEYLSKHHVPLFIFHKIGSGKTCTAIQIARGSVAPIIVMPASLIPGFYDEVRSACITPNPFVTPAEIAKLRQLEPKSREYRDIIATSNARINAKFSIYSFNSFATSPPKTREGTLIVDECQNIAHGGKFYAAIAKFVRDRPALNIVLMSATPIFDSSREIFNLLALMRRDVSDVDRLTDGERIFNPAGLKQLFSGIISYFPGAPPHTFPHMAIHEEICKMSPMQSRQYTSEIEAELTSYGNLRYEQISNMFYSKSRQRANVVFPSDLTATDGITKMTDAKLTDHLGTYSTKFARLIKYLTRKEHQLVYSNFTNWYGLRLIAKILAIHGFKDYLKAGPGPKRFAFFTGDQTAAEKQAVRTAFNRESNDDCGDLQIILGSPAIKEGVSFLRGRRLHIIEPHWNWSRMDQIIGRFSRFCSHKSLPASERNLDVHIYLAVAITYNRKEPNPHDSIDAYILSLANRKLEINNQFLQLMKDAAIDKDLFQKKMN